MKELAYFVIVLIFLNGCATITATTSSKKIVAIKPKSSESQKDRWKLLAGKWYGNQIEKDGGWLEWIVDRSIDGKYRIDFRLHNEDGTYKDQVEVGEWGISGPIYFSIFKGWLKNKRFSPNDATNPNNRDAYKILKLDSEIFIYKNFETGNEYTVKKVPETFSFDND